MAFDLSRKTELDADQKSVQQIELVGLLKKLDYNGNVIDAGADQSMFVFTILEKLKETRQKGISRKCNTLIKYGKL